MNINKSDLKKVKEFLLKYDDPAVVEIETIKEGCVSLIKPIRTICAAEIHCAPKTAVDVRKAVYENKLAEGSVGF